MRSKELELSQYLNLLIENPFSCYFQVLSPYYDVGQCSQKAPISISSRLQVRSHKTKKG